MYKKYKPLMISKLKSLNIPFSDWDDYLQEGYEIMHKAISLYNPMYKKTFTRYFELLLIRRFLYLRKRNLRDKFYVMNEEVIEYVLNIENEERVDIEVKDFKIPNLSDFEQKIIEFVFEKGYSYKETAKILKCDSKKIYNAIQRIKNKGKTFLKL